MRRKPWRLEAALRNLFAGQLRQDAHAGIKANVPARGMSARRNRQSGAMRRLAAKQIHASVTLEG
jgi:hypothetical protein